MQQSAPAFGRRNILMKYPPASNSSWRVLFFPPTLCGGSASFAFEASTANWLRTLTPNHPAMQLKSEPTPGSSPPPIGGGAQKPSIPPPPADNPSFDDPGLSEPTPGSSPPPTGP